MWIAWDGLLLLVKRRAVRVDDHDQPIDVGFILKTADYRVKQIQH
jgi:hypothetical protein